MDNCDLNEDKKEEDNDNKYKNYDIMKKYCNDNNYEFLIFNPKNNNFYIDNNNNLENIDFHYYYDNKFKNIVSNYIFKDEEKYNLTKMSLISNEISKNDKEFISTSIKDIKDKQLIFIGKFKKEENIDIELDLINDNYLIYFKDKKNKNIYFKKNFFSDNFKDSNKINSNLFYLFDTSLNAIKKEEKKKILI